MERVYGNGYDVITLIIFPRSWFVRTLANPYLKQFSQNRERNRGSDSSTSLQKEKSNCQIYASCMYSFRQKCHNIHPLMNLLDVGFRMLQIKLDAIAS